MAPHRLLALLRAHNEGIISLGLKPHQDSTPLVAMERMFIGNRKGMTSMQGPSSSLWQMEQALTDAYRRLIHPSIENEVLNFYKEKADKESIKVFSENLDGFLIGFFFIKI